MLLASLLPLDHVNLASLVGICTKLLLFDQLANSSMGPLEGGKGDTIFTSTNNGVEISYYTLEKANMI